MPCFNNLVLFNPFKPTETLDTIIPELAERWSWQDGYRNLVFFLRKTSVARRRPFTAKDVKYTFDIVREAKDAPREVSPQPRKDWYANVDSIEAADPYRDLPPQRPQPSCS